jgi:LysM repeat protein
MKRISILLAICLVAPLLVRAQDAATEERLNKLQSQIEALQTSNVDLQKRLADTTKELQELREQLARPSGNYAAAEDVKHLADAIKEVDRKREADRDLILDELKKLAKPERRPIRIQDDAPKPSADNPARPEKGYEYIIQSGDTLSTVVAEYRKQGVKVTVDDVLKANPGLKPTSLKVGQKIFIPASGQ